MKLNRAEKLIFALLRRAVNDIPVDEELLKSCTESDWEECFRIAVEQGVMAIAWDPIMELPYELQPPKMLKLRWGIAVENYSKMYRRYCDTAAVLSRFYEGLGIRMLLLKGVGLSTYYPVPERRQGGDIDIYTYSADPGKMGDHEANKLADKLMEERGISVSMHGYKHSNFNFRGVPIENHKHFLNVGHYKVAVEAESVLFKVMEPRSVKLCDEYEVLVPSPEFNSIFVTIHALQHFTSLSLHHLCDVACVMKQADMSLLLSVGDERFRNGVKSVMMLCKKYLGSDVEVDLLSKELCDIILQEMFHPKFNKDNFPTNPVGIIIYKLRRFMYSYRHYSKVWRKSLWRAVKDSVVSHCENPKLILGK